MLWWPAAALLAWGAAWITYATAARASWPVAAAFAAALVAPVFVAVLEQSAWRRVFALAGFPVSWLLLRADGLPAWAWLAALALLMLAYPARAWRDAPFFPTRRDALLGLRARLSLPHAPRLLDAGCGAGDGLLALRAAWPDAACEGVEWSRPLAWVSKLRCPQARIRRGDMWADDWSGCDLVYLFQRPESMQRAWRKAREQMRSGSWLVSLEFVVPDVAPTLTLAPSRPGGRPVHAWCIVHDDAPQTGGERADNPSRPRQTRKRGRR